MVFEILILKRDDDGAVVCPHCNCVKADKVPSLFSGKVEGSAAPIVGSASSCSGCTSSSCASCK